MSIKMSSRERMLAALRRQDVDYVPCCPHFSASLLGPEYTWRERADSLERVVGELGLDSFVVTSVEASTHPDVSAKTWLEERPGERWPILHKEVETPAGTLSAAIYVTEDLPNKGDIALNDDWNVSRYVKPWIETMQDVECYRYLQLPPLDGEIARARERYATAKCIADQWGVATYASCGQGLTSAILVLGAQQAVLMSMTQPDLIRRFLEIEHQATMRRAEVLADLGVDIIVRNGFYETTDFWSPTQLREWLVPYLREEIQAMHSGGAVVAYTVETGLMPILDILQDLPFDCYFAIEPVLGQADMGRIAAALTPSHAIWGGVSGPMHIGEGTPEVARQAVRDAFDTIGRGGLVLSAVPSIRAHWPWENALAMFDEWRRLRATS